MDLEVIENIKKVRTKFSISFPFFACHVFKMPMVAVTGNPQIKTACTDGVIIYFNVDWVKSLSIHELIGTVAHEVLHIAGDHINRLGDRNLELFNEACDYAINPILKEFGFVLPKGALFNDEFRMMTPEYIYEILNKSKVKGKYKPTNTDHLIGGFIKPDFSKGSYTPIQAPTEAEWQYSIPSFKDKDQLEKARLETLFIATAQQKAHGKMPSSMVRFLGESKLIKTNWLEELTAFLNNTVTSHYAWNKPKSSYLQRDIIMPSLVKRKTGYVAIIVDTSGSITDKLLNFMNRNIVNISEILDQEVIVIFADADVAKIVEYAPGDAFGKLEPKGGGGTDFRPALKYISEKDVCPDCVVYLTDGLGTFPTEAPEFPVLWGTVNANAKFPFGHVINLPVEEL